MLELDFIAQKDKLKIKREGDKRFIFGCIRKKYLVLQPEEFVRQLVVSYLININKFNKNRIAVEKQLIVNDLKKRCDILVYDSQVMPFLLIECKAPNISISQQTFRQIAWYNMPLKVPFLMVTNGQETFVCKIDYEKKTFQFVNEIPVYQ